MGMLKANREPKDFRGWLVSHFNFENPKVNSKLYHLFQNMKRSLNVNFFFPGLLPTPNGRSCTIFARTRMVCFTKIQLELSMMEAYLNTWRRKELQPKRERNGYINLLHLWIIVLVTQINESWEEKIYFQLMQCCVRKGMYIW